MSESQLENSHSANITASNGLTTNILFGVLFGAIVGLIIRFSPDAWQLQKYLTDGILHIGGTAFIRLMEMLVVPVVLVSLTCGIASLNDVRALGRIGVRSLVLFVITTAIAVFWAILFANLFHIGFGMHLASVSGFHVAEVPSLKEFFINIVPNNPIKALVDVNLLQIIVFAVLLGITINLTGESGKRLEGFFQDLNAVVMKMIMLLMRFAPIGVFCLIAILFAKLGFDVLSNLFNYFLTVMFVLVFHAVVTYSLILAGYCRLNPKTFFRKMYSVALFAFSVSSSNATIPLALETITHKLGVSSSVTSFVIPLGVNVNKNGTAIMQGVAAIFIAHAYGLNIGLVGYITILLTTIMASIGTAGVPGVGIIALIMVLKQLGLPLDGIGLILGIDRLLDMARTAINVLGNALVACVVGKSEGKLDSVIYNS